MKPLTFEALEGVAKVATKTLPFPSRNIVVTVRELNAEEFGRIQKAIAGKPKSSSEANRQTELLICSVGITDADYDSDDGRKKLAKHLPERMRTKIANEILTLSAADIGGIPKNLPRDSGLPSASVSPLDGLTQIPSSKRSRNGNSRNGKHITN